MSLLRGDIVLLDFPFSGGIGSKIRPAVVIQCDRNNQRLANTIVAMITRNTQRVAAEPTQLLIDLTTPEGRQTGLAYTSAIKCENLFTVQQNAVMKRVGRLTIGLLQRLDACIKASVEV